MKRDMELVRKIILRIEDGEHGFCDNPFVVDGYSEEQVAYHAYLMKQGGLIEAFETTCQGDESPSATPTALTWEGHEFADNARSDTNWNKAKTTVISKRWQRRFWRFGRTAKEACKQRRWTVAPS